MSKCTINQYIWSNFYKKENQNFFRHFNIVKYGLQDRCICR